MLQKNLKKSKTEDFHGILGNIDILHNEHEIFRNCGREKTIRLSKHPIIPNINHIG